MNDLNRQAVGKLGRFLAALPVAVFLTAWTVDYWQAWIFLAIFSAASLAVTAYLMKHDPRLLERRIYAGPLAERHTRQRIIQLLAFISFFAIVLFPPIDHRFRWSTVPPYVSIAGDALAALGFVLVFLVFKENTFASALIEIDSAQTVVSTGPYAVVRHPMYAGALVLLIGTPLALGSWWGLLTVVPITLVIIWRLLDEEQFLTTSLPGYAEYRNRVTYRLVPRVW
ncbi:MAG TPA: isoprenylcysteine carboxylmethyltransferase family protein [Candidatus Binataceae bacterium]|nr:isoprenylcysteine carboxylmethyltransferase family protein [Candidatus Binataceae bacterium]